MIDRLIDAIIEKQNPTAVGLDTKFDYLPDDFKNVFTQGAAGDTLYERMAQAVFAYNRELIDAVCDLVPAVKVQVAYYEMAGLYGMKAFYDTLSYARYKGLVTIADVKRNDIGATAEAYAAAYFDERENDGQKFSAFPADMVTVNGYLGSDGVAPFTKLCKSRDKGIFVLVKTSNPSSGELQDMTLADGRTVYQVMGDRVALWGQDTIGRYGYSDVGAVVGATYPSQGAELRERLKEVFFLIPGYGAQGAGGRDLVGCFDVRGLGGIVNASRSILCAWKKDETADFASAARAEVLRMREDILGALSAAGKAMPEESSSI